MHGYLHSLNVPTVTDLIGGLLHRVTAASRAWQPRRRVNGSAAASYRSYRDRLRPRQPRRRRSRRPGVADPQGAANTASGRCHPVRPTCIGGGAGARITRRRAHRCRQEGLRPRLQAGRHQRSDGGARLCRPPGRASQGGRSTDVRPPRGGDRCARRGRHRFRGHSRHLGRAGRRLAAWRSSTRRRGARRFQAITGHATDGRLPDDFDWSGVADAKTTTAVYMPKATIGVLCAELLRRGLSAAHPAVAVFNATRANETIVTASIGTLPERIAAVDTGAPCIILIGVDATKRTLAVRSPAREHVNA